MFYEMSFTVPSRDLDCMNFCKPSALLGYLQDAAAMAALAMNVSNDQMVAKYRHIWMLAKLHVTLDAPIRWRDTLTVKTWHRGGEKTVMYREYDLAVNGGLTGRALAAWVLADMDSRTLSRFDRFPEFIGTDGGELIRDTKIPHVRFPQEMALASARQLHYSDTDSNGHVNNTRYADFLCDALGMEEAPAGTFLREFALIYHKECRAGETLTLYADQADGKGFVKGVDAADETRFQGWAVFGEKA